MELPFYLTIFKHKVIHTKDTVETVTLSSLI